MYFNFILLDCNLMQNWTDAERERERERKKKKGNNSTVDKN